MSKKSQQLTNKSTSKTGWLGNFSNQMLLVFIFAFALFANSIPADYNLDDELVTRQHRLTSKGISAIPEIFRSPYYEDASGYSYEYRPVVLASFAIEHQLFGDKPAVSHFINVLLYALICVLLLYVLKNTLHQFPPILPIAITLLYAAHTSHTEVVCSIKNRDELLALGFSLLCLSLSLSIVKNNKLALALALPILFTLGLMSKLTVLSFAVIIPLCLLFFTNVNLLQFSLVSLLMVLPLYWLLNVPTGFGRLKIMGGFTLINFIAYGIKYASVHFEQAKTWLSSIKHKLPDFTEITTLSENHVSGIKTLLKDIIPPAGYFQIKFLLAAPVFTAAYLLCVNQNYYLLSLAAMLFLLYYKWRGTDIQSWWASVSIIFALSLNVFVAQQNHLFYTFYSNQYIPFIAFCLFHERRSLFVPSLIAVLLYLYLCIPLEHFSSPAPVILGWIITTNRFGRYASIAVLTIVMIVKYPYDGIEQAFGFVEQLTFALALTATYHLNKGLKQLLLIMALIATLVFHIPRVTFNPTNTIQNTTRTIANVSNNATPQMVAKKQDRPLHFIEVCVTFNDPVAIRLGTSFEILFYCLKNTVVPYPLSFYYGYSFIKPMQITDTLPLISLVLYALIFAAAMALIKKQPVISFGLFLYLLSIAVFSNYEQHVPGMLADRFLLIPSLGWCMVLAGLLAYAFKLQDIRLVSWASIPATPKYILTGILATYSILTFARNFDWHDDLTLFRKDIKYVSQSSQAHNLLALHIMQHTQKETDPAVATRQMQEAVAHFKKAQEIYPSVFNIAYDIGRVYNGLNQPDSALASFLFALTIDSTYPTLYANIADIYFAKGDYNNALIYLQKYVRDAPNEFAGYNKMSFIFYQQKKYEESIAISKQGLQRLPGTLDACLNIGRVYMELNNIDSALYYFGEANRLAPGNPAVINSLKQLEQLKAKGQ